MILFRNVKEHSIPSLLLVNSHAELNGCTRQGHAVVPKLKKLKVSELKKYQKIKEIQTTNKLVRL